MEYVTLNDGNKMPLAGFGVFQIPDPKEAAQSVSDAINSGYQLIDTARAYNNEEAVGNGIKASGAKRDDLFIASKLWVSDTGYEKTKAAFETSLQKLQLDYLDLYLIHQPYGDIYGSWRAMEDLQKEGKIRSIGVSNFERDRVTDLATFNNVKPAVNQIELNPWFQQPKEIEYYRQYDVQPEAWAPFAEGKHDIFKNEILSKIAASHHKTVGQVILRWLTQNKIVALAKSVHKERMAENIDIFDFELTDAEMSEITKLDRGESQFFDHHDPEQVKRMATLH